MDGRSTSDLRELTLHQFLSLLRDQRFSFVDDFEVWYRSKSMIKPREYPDEQSEDAWAGHYLSWKSECGFDCW